MKLYRLRQTAFWGDYGTTLARGLHTPRDLISDHLILERVGPFVPPMIFNIEPLVGFVVLVTQSFREKLEAANFGNLAFKPTIKKHIVDLPWETWDRKTRLPPMLPDSGVPDDYILKGRHSEETAAKMEEIWEFSAPELPFEIDRRERVRPRPFHYHWFISAPKGEHKGLFRPFNHAHVLFVDESGRHWFEREGKGWIDFDDVSVI